MDSLHLPTLNAILNFTSAVCLAAGYWFIRRKNIPAHRLAMTAAFCVSTVFLISYLTYHYTAGSTKFTGTGAVRTVYFAILLSHTILAAAVAPMAIATMFRAVRGRYPEHRKIARYTWPVWIYVSLTGVIIYWMLYQ